MYTFFELSGTKAARAFAAAGALTITAILMASAIIPASPTPASPNLATPETVLLTTGVLA